MKRRSGHLQVLAALSASGADYLLVGASALGHNAPDAASFHATADCDLLIRPASANRRFESTRWSCNVFWNAASPFARTARPA